MSERKNRLDYIDRAKGILIILVVIGHIWQAGKVFNTIYVFHMPAFFVISGLLLGITKSYRKGFGSFFLRRLYAFGIPFVFIELLGVLTDIIRNGVTLNWKGYLFNTLSLRYNDHNLWFIVSLFLVELIFAALALLLRRKWAVCAAALFFASFLPLGTIPVLSTLASSMKYLPYFVVGFYGRELLEQRRIWLICLSGAAVLAAGLFFGHKFADLRIPFQPLKYLIQICFGILGTYFVLQISGPQPPEPFNRILGGAGRNSIIIFGTHHIIYAAVAVLLGISDFGTTPLWAGLIMLAAVALLEPPIIYIVNRWLPFLAGRHYRDRHKYIRIPAN